MKLAKYRTPTGEVAVGSLAGEELTPLILGSEFSSLSDILEAEAPGQAAASILDSSAKIALSEVKLLTPVDEQEIWAAGVTYKRSKTARMEESEAAASCYDRVYDSPRPELFLKATPHRVSGPGQPLRIRVDSEWNVPEPELTLVINTKKTLVGFTIGNDMSSRDIEGDNPLYLPQAKVYNQSAGVGPWITLADSMPPREEIGISLTIRRDGEVAFEGQTGIDQMARTFEDLIGWLGRDNSFPAGVMLMTGTGIVPDSNFTLQAGDSVDITIDGIGTLSNPIVQG
jgi:2-dehydro-3-deoxy-D-arabinonate dehydratase